MLYEYYSILSQFGGDKRWESIIDMVTTEDVDTIEVEIPEKYSRLWFVLCPLSTSGANATLDLRFNNSSAARLQLTNSVHSIVNRDVVIYIEKVPGYYPIVFFGNNEGSTLPKSSVLAAGFVEQKYDWNSYMGNVIICAIGTQFASGSTIKIWGCE